MSAVLRIWRRVSLLVDGVVKQDHGQVEVPGFEVTVTGTPHQPPRTFSLAPGETKTLWEYTVDGSFSFMNIEADGYAWLSFKVDAADTDGDATGTSVNYAKAAVSDGCPHMLDTRAFPVNVSAANYAASAFHADTATGRVFKVEAKNPSETETVQVTLNWVL